MSVYYIIRFSITVVVTDAKVFNSDVFVHHLCKSALVLSDLIFGLIFGIFSLCNKNIIQQEYIRVRCVPPDSVTAIIYHYIVGLPNHSTGGRTAY